MPILGVKSVSVRFGGVVALDGVSFDMEPRQIVGLIGPNGAGKTTLFNCLSRLYTPSEGTIEFDGAAILDLPAHRMSGLGIGRTFQNLQIFFNMSALENVMTGRHLRERCSLLATLLRTPALVRAEADCRALALRLLGRVGLGEYRDAAADAMPYGALKRLEIARALAAEPSLLLLDEPAAGLNQTEAREIDALIKQLAAEGTTIVLVEHNMRLVMEVSDHVLVLDHGRKLAEGTPAQVSANPLVIEAYLGVAEPQAAHA